MMGNRRTFLKQTIATALGMSIPFELTGAANSAAVEHSRAKRIAGNPIIPGKGLCDPQVRLFDGKVYLYATHDASARNRFYHMEDWWVWSSDDLVHWTQVSTLKPEQTFLRKPFGDCWATDAATRNGQYFFYFSAGPEEIGVVVGDTPAGPWRDPLGRPLIAKGLTPTEQRDPGILMDLDGSAYIVFGTFDFYIARLNEDMISLAEAPRLILLDRKAGPYGEGKTDDKPFLHVRAGKFYLSWGCFYAMADNPYGPYAYKGSIIDAADVAAEFQNHELLMDRHGSFFEFNRQWYFACNDYSQPGTSQFFRNSVLSYVHYLENGEIAPVRIDRIGVGQYDAAAGKVEAEDYFRLTGGAVREHPSGGFVVAGLGDRSALIYPKIANVPRRPKLIARLASNGKGRLEIHSREPHGPLLASAALSSTGGWDQYHEVEVPLPPMDGAVDLALVFRGGAGELARLDSWRLVGRG